jgi:hypothetical protein
MAFCSRCCCRARGEPPADYKHCSARAPSLRRRRRCSAAERPFRSRLPPTSRGKPRPPARPDDARAGWGLPSAGEPTGHRRGSVDRRPRTHGRRGQQACGRGLLPAMITRVGGRRDWNGRSPRRASPPDPSTPASVLSRGTKWTGRVAATWSRAISDSPKTSPQRFRRRRSHRGYRRSANPSDEQSAHRRSASPDRRRHREARREGSFFRAGDVGARHDRSLRLAPHRAPTGGNCRRDGAGSGLLANGRFDRVDVRVAS